MTQRILRSSRVDGADGLLVAIGGEEGHDRKTRSDNPGGRMRGEYYVGQPFGLVIEASASAERGSASAA